MHYDSVLGKYASQKKSKNPGGWEWFLIGLIFGGGIGFLTSAIVVRIVYPPPIPVRVVPVYHEERK